MRHRKGKLVLARLLPVELTNGNDGRGSKWFSSAKLRKQYEIDLLGIRAASKQPFAFPTINVVTRIIGKGQRLWDSSSIGRGNWKEIEDALVALGWWHDDSPKYIVRTEFDQDATQRDVGPATKLEVFSVLEVAS